MCKLCDAGVPQDHSGSRRNFLKATTATGLAAAAGLGLLTPRAAAAGEDKEPEDSGGHGRRYLIRGGSVQLRPESSRQCARSPSVPDL